MLLVESNGNCSRTYNLCHVDNLTIPTTTSTGDPNISIPTTPESNNTITTDDLTSEGQNIDRNASIETTESSDRNATFDETTYSTRTDHPLTTVTDNSIIEKTTTPYKQTTGVTSTYEDQNSNCSNELRITSQQAHFNLLCPNSNCSLTVHPTNPQGKYY